MNAFLSPDFTLAAGRVRPGARVAVLEDGGEIVGFFPFERGRFRIGRPIATGVSDCQGVVHAQGFRWSTQDLLRGCDLDVWEFDHLLGSQAAWAGQHIAGRAAPIIDVSRGYELYIAERQRASKKIVKSTLYKQRKLDRDLGPTRFEFDVQDARALRLLMKWKSAQYRRTGRRDRFAIGWIQRLVMDLFEARPAGCIGTLSVLYSDDRVVAAHFGLRSHFTLSCWFPAYDVGLAKYSPGLSLHLRMAEAAPAAGVRFLELGKGDEEYKESLKTGDVSVGEGWIERPSVIAVARRVQRSPRRFAFMFVSRHPRLRTGARNVLKRVGALRGSQ